MKMILFNQNPMITKLLESVSKKLELSIENFNHYQELSARLKEDPEWILIADDECLEKLDQVDWLELKEIISQNKNSVCMYKKGHEAQPFLEGFEMKMKKPFLPTEVLKILQKKLGSNMSELEPSQNLDPTQEVLETNWDELENLGDLEALVQEEPNNEEQLLPTLNDQEVKEEIKEEEKQEVKETPQEEEKPKDDETQGSVETPKDEEVSKELETQEEPVKEQEPIKEETQEIKEEKQEKTQDSPSTQELEAMQELVKEIQENSNGQEDKEETQESAETPQEKETQELEIPKEEIQEETQEAVTETPQTQENAETPQDVENQAQEIQDKEIQETQEIQESAETPQDVENPQENAEIPQEEAQEKETQEDHYESIEDIPEPVMAKAMGEELPFLNEAVAETPNNENDTETPKESVTETPKESDIKTPQEKEESDKTSSPLELRLNLQDLLKSLNQESLKSLLENKTLSIKITLEDKKPNA
ncbi:chemotaxis regulatory protein ChePep [Helicobacter pylori]|uniref:chemotaxis regulatory protein ChePep n=1 Tax=Helicobacter pylori TaxID=210 RepID=UPI000EB35684|nr:chemotaxis regulatory protein ChePep [Helicobacter pylori]